MAAPKVPQGKNGSNSIEPVLQALYYELKTLPVYATVSVLPAAAGATRGLAYCGNGAAGAPAIVYNDGTAWKVVAALGAVAKATA
jgi:hypothetical protein